MPKTEFRRERRIWWSTLKGWQLCLVYIGLAALSCIHFICDSQCFTHTQNHLSCTHFTYDSQCFTHTHTHKTICLVYISLMIPNALHTHTHKTICLVYISLMIPNATHTHTKPSVLYTVHLWFPMLHTHTQNHLSCIQFTYDSQCFTHTQNHLSCSAVSTIAWCRTVRTISTATPSCLQATRHQSPDLWTESSTCLGWAFSFTMGSERVLHAWLGSAVSFTTGSERVSHAWLGSAVSTTGSKQASHAWLSLAVSFTTGRELAPEAGLEMCAASPPGAVQLSRWAEGGADHCPKLLPALASFSRFSTGAGKQR